jgi:hypothetical protein
MQTGWQNSYPTLGYYVETFESGMEVTENNFGNYQPATCTSETAWGYNEDYSIDFLNDSFFSNPEFSNWGWTNGPIDMATDGSLELELLAGAGSTGKGDDKQSNVENGEYVGTVFIEWSSGHITVTYVVDSPHKLEDVHLWVGNTMLPTTKKDKFTNAPGKFPYGNADFENDGNTWTIEIDEIFDGDIYIAAHAVVCIPDTMNGDSR